LITAVLYSAAHLFINTYC